MNQSEIEVLTDLAPVVCGAQHITVDAVLKETPQLERAIAVFDGFQCASFLAGLLTVPELQCNCYRLETLLHLSVALGKGNKRPSKTSIASWFQQVGAGICGKMEDPAEDVFVSVVTTRRGSFRILEGTWESAGFYLQRVLNVVERMPDDGVFKSIKNATHALLQLSDLVCDRAGLQRYQRGNRYPLDSIPKRILDELNIYRRRVVFSRPELQGASIDWDDLHTFCFDQRYASAIRRCSVSHNALLHFPLIDHCGQIVAALPTAFSVAIRALVIEWMTESGLRETLCRAIASEYANYFQTAPPLRTARGAPIAFRESEQGVKASYGVEVDVGRWLQFLFVVDTLEGFANTGLVGVSEGMRFSPQSFDQEINPFRKHASNSKEFKQGLTIVVGCGVGRPEVHAVNEPDTSSTWDVTYLSAPDLAVLTSLSEVTSQTFFRLFEAQAVLLGRGIRFVNVNGVLNLISWMRSLDGHLIPHNQMPVAARESRAFRIVLDPSIILDIRHEAMERTDRHAALSVNGEYIEVRKADVSQFAEDRKLALYVAMDFDEDGALPLLFEGEERLWWCKVRRCDGYERWKMMATWLPKIARVFEQETSALPDCLLICVSFDGIRKVSQYDSATCFDDIRGAIQVDVDVAHATVCIIADAHFERGLADPANIAEAALVESAADGLLRLAGQHVAGRAEILRKRIVCDVHARDSHVFAVREFRDHVNDAISEKVIVADPVDYATLRIGLGWRIRESASADITGKSECTQFLNCVVAALEKDLCAALRQFDRSAVLQIALGNYEAAMRTRGIWRRTAAANLALHTDKAAVHRTLAERESEMNGALLGSRLVAEVAVCECPLHGGMVPGSLDLSVLMARALLIHVYGGWSDAIYFDAMAPSLTVTPLGDIYADLTFFNAVVDPFHMVSHGSMIRAAVSDYPINFRMPAVTPSVEELLEPEFIAAWKEERLDSIEDFRRFIDDVEDYAIKENRAILEIRRSALVTLSRSAVENVPRIIDGLTMVPRASWRTLPAGYIPNDCNLWRFRRQLSLLRLPIVQVDNQEDPLLIVSPGILRESLAYMVRSFHEGSFRHSQLKSPSMLSWFGRVADTRGSRFSKKVANEMAMRGWKVETEVSVSKILQMPLDRFGDVDVLATHAEDHRVLLIECKDLQFHKTAGELAEQLRDFRGVEENGKRDKLRKHLDRCEVLMKHKDRLAAYVKAQGDPSIEAWVVFRNPVPMLFAWKGFGDRIRTTTFDQLGEI